MSDPLRDVVSTMAAVLLSFGSALLVGHLAHLGSTAPILAVVLALTLSRTAAQAGRADLGRRVVALPIVAYAATQVGRLMLHHVVLGDAVFVLALSGAIWLRRFGRVAARLGGLISLPFIGILIVPVPLSSVKSMSSGSASSGWVPVIALLAVGWVTAVAALAHRIGWAPAPRREPEAPRPADRRQRPAPQGERGRAVHLPTAASTKMALQLGLALGLAFLVGHWLYPQHWSWLVVSCYLICSGNRGRGDVLHKGVLRLVGAGIGTASATLLAGAFGPGDPTAIVLIFVVLGVATWLRQRSYAFWAAGVTAMLALLNGYYGLSGAHELVQRLGGVALGALIGVAVSWFLFPVRSDDVFRRRVANSLAALSDYLAALRTEPDAVGARADAFAHSVTQLEQLLPTFRFHQRTVFRLSRERPGDPHAADVIRVLADLRAPLTDLHEAVCPDGPERALAVALGGLARQVGTIRRRMRPTTPAAEPATAVVNAGLVSADDAGAALSATVALLDRLDTAFTVELWRRHGGRPSPPAS